MRSKLNLVLILLYRTNSTKVKPPLINELRENIEAAKIEIRILFDLKQLTLRQYSRTSVEVETISKQLSAWNKYELKRNIIELGQMIESRELKIRHYGRYVDDFYIVHNDKEYLKSIINQIKDFLSSDLELTLHPKKIYLQNINKGVSFLGFVVKPYSRLTGNRILKNFRATLLSYKQSEAERLNVSESINSYLGMMRHGRSLGIRRKILLSHRWIFNQGRVNSLYTRYRMTGR